MRISVADILIDKEKEEEPPKLVLSRGSMLLAESSTCEPAFNVYCQHSEGESRLTVTTDPVRHSLMIIKHSGSLACLACLDKLCAVDTEQSLS